MTGKTVVPEEAVEAAAKEMYKRKDMEVTFGDVARAALEAAAPFIAAKALEGAAEWFAARLPDGTGNGRAYNSHQVARMLHARAAAVRGEG
ncbi:MAG: hypothetical protein M3O29_04350 [Actinomycetota bacterium]|nr:hypothetical protein [Actinomycetota bacterium]